MARRSEGTNVVSGAADPLAANRSLTAMATPDGTALLVLRNFHRYLGSAEVVQALDSQVSAEKQARTFVVILAPVVQVTVELEKLLVIVEHDLSEADRLGSIARSIAIEPGELPVGEGLTAVLDAAAPDQDGGREAFCLSLVRHGRLAPEVLWEIKAGMLKESGLLTLHRGGETFADLGGLEALMSFCSRGLRLGRPEGVRARGCSCSGHRPRARACSVKRWAARRVGRR